jgi:hypothetical protein
MRMMDGEEGGSGDGWAAWHETASSEKSETGQAADSLQEPDRMHRRSV